jgi:hypothetical protein
MPINNLTTQAAFQEIIANNWKCKGWMTTELTKLTADVKVDKFVKMWLGVVLACYYQSYYETSKPRVIPIYLNYIHSSFFQVVINVVCDKKFKPLDKNSNGWIADPYKRLNNSNVTAYYNTLVPASATFASTTMKTCSFIDFIHEGALILNKWDTGTSLVDGNIALEVKERKLDTIVKIKFKALTIYPGYTPPASILSWNYS